MMECSLKLRKKIKPSGKRKIFRRGAPPTALRASGPPPAPSSSRQGRLVSSKEPSRDHWLTGSHARHWKASLSIRRATPSSTLSTLVSLARTPSLPFDEGAQSRTQDPRRLRRGPHCAAVVDGLRCRPFDRPTDRAPFPVLKPLTH